MSDLKQHKFYKRAYDAHRGTSFDPERRAEQECTWYDAAVAELTEAGKASAIEKLDRLYAHQLACKARIVSFMIVGPARFPVARMEKYNRWEHASTERLLAFLEALDRPPVQPRTELDYGIEAKEYDLAGVTVKHNKEQNRLQLIFPDKPEEEMRDRLKKRGFKWSPRNAAWQRQLTPNAITAARALLTAEGRA